MRNRFIKNTDNRINRVCHGHITEETYPEWCDECKRLPDEEKVGFFRRKFEEGKAGRG